MRAEVKAAAWKSRSGRYAGNQLTAWRKELLSPVVRIFSLRFTNPSAADRRRAVSGLRSASCAPQFPAGAGAAVHRSGVSAARPLGAPSAREYCRRLTNRHRYVLKRDVRKFFPNLEH